MSFLYRAIGTTAVAATALVGANLSAMADTITISGANLGLLSYTAPGSSISTGTTTSAFNGTNAAVLTSADNFHLTAGVRSTYATDFNDTANVTVNNGAVIGGSTVSLGTLSNLMAAGAAGNISFTTTGVTGPGSPYFQVTLVDPNNASNTIRVNSAGVTGPTSIFNQGNNAFATAAIVLGTYDGTFLKNSPTIFPNAPGSTGLTNAWSDIAADSVDGTLLANWNVGALSVVDGAFNGGGPVSAQITGLTVTSVAAVPEPSTWAMMMLGFAGLGLLSYRRTRRNGGLNLRIA